MNPLPFFLPQPDSIVYISASIARTVPAIDVDCCRNLLENFGLCKDWPIHGNRRQRACGRDEEGGQAAAAVLLLRKLSAATTMGRPKNEKSFCMT